MNKHPFEPLVYKHSKTLLIGSLPPETAPFYFSNSPSTRLWDLLFAIKTKSEIVGKGMYEIDKKQKIELLEDLNLSIADIIYEYERTDMQSGEDDKIIPFSYTNICSLIQDTEITKLLFVYKSAANWFLHSLTKEKPLPIRKIKYEINWDTFHKFKLNNREITCILLPNPLSRGKSGESLAEKLKAYRSHILN